MNISVNISVGELLDKMTILSCKRAFIFDEEKLKHVVYELEKNRLIWEKESSSMDDLLKCDVNNLYARLMDINVHLWYVEDRLRVLEKMQKFDQEFIDLARDVYVSNDERALIKRELNRITESEIVEVKSYG